MAEDSIPTLLSHESAARDDRLAAAIEWLLERSTDPQAELERICSEHPDLAVELRGLWATVQIADLCGEIIDEPVPASNSAAAPDSLEDYELMEELGRGGMGVVYRACQKSLGREVALKMVVRPDLATSSDLSRFRLEAEAAARLEHPHIVPIYEVGAIAEPGTRDHSVPFFTMRLIEGQTLAQRLADSPLSARQAAALLVPVCRAVQAAHERGFVHRDLKPSNILIDLEGRPYVGDFGLAKRLPGFGPPADSASATVVGLADAGLTQTGAILGTPAYMAPEQASGRGTAGTAADIYSLGAILYACLTGRPPLQGATPAETVLMVLDHDPPPPRLLNPQTDPDLELVVLKCLQKPADLRYTSAARLADDLDAFLANEPISARSTRLHDVLSRAFRETHHAAVLENWGLLWMWHAVALFGLCVVTNALQLLNVTSRWPFLLLWTAGLGAWALVFWSLRRRAGPVTFVERQIAHAWAGAMVCSTLLYAVESLLGLPVLSLSPVLPLVSGMTFVMKAAILSGGFYLPAAALFATAPLMAYWPSLPGPNLALTAFGIVSGFCFFLPGVKYWRQAGRP